MSTRQRLGLVVMLFGLDCMIAAPHTVFTGTMFLTAKIGEILGAFMLVIPNGARRG